MTMFQNLHRSMRSFDTLKLQCEGCDRLTRFTAVEARACFGADATPQVIRRQSRCPACGAEGQMKVWI